MHVDAIARWFARRRKTSLQKVLLDLEIRPPSNHPDDCYYSVEGKRTHAFVEAGNGDIWRWERNQTGPALIGNVCK